jgi:hypothetical protein
LTKQHMPGLQHLDRHYCSIFDREGPFPEECRRICVAALMTLSAGSCRIKLFGAAKSRKVYAAHDLVQGDQVFIFQSSRALGSGFQSVASFRCFISLGS